ncbi:hypothetical protein BDM02DRAFT_1069769 [Thelephora ganbajun]|uniref:Uncharacterized protein n=1 Tax=Thelephora ganbajun TaxID=370292 RepID=A0ACB6ZWH8_THEGA|nr:hypothetical protein BDM02DRAFT_1069769 [Thelephora ganbajun]
MSYASVTSHNAPADQPLPDPALLNTAKPTASGVADDTAKVGVVSPNFKQNPATTTSTYQPPRYVEEESDSSPHRRTAKNKAKAKKLAHDVEKEAIHWSAVVQELVLRPSVAGGLVGVVNLGLIGYAGYKFYNEPHLRQDHMFLTSTIASAAVVIGLEGYGAQTFAPVREEEDVLIQYVRQNPKATRTLFAVLNVGILGATGYLAYSKWNRWDNRTFVTLAAGLASFGLGESYLVSHV